MANKILFLDRDGTLIDEPVDTKQVDCLSKLALKKNVIPGLIALKNAGYALIMITNQDGLGTSTFPEVNFIASQNMLITLFASQGITFDKVLICPHFANDNCQCRKPGLGLVMEYLRNGKMDFANSYVIGDRNTDMQLAENMGIRSILYAENDWLEIAEQILLASRSATSERITNETRIRVNVDLNNSNQVSVQTGIKFFDHMLEQLAKHAGFNLVLEVKGDLDVDEHHTVEDTAIALGDVLRIALGDKLGINRYGFALPMDEARVDVVLDLSGRPYFKFSGHFPREKVGDLPTELISHFFYSLAMSLQATLHIEVKGENAHHMIESIFKCVGRALRAAITRQGYELPTTKGVL